MITVIQRKNRFNRSSPSEVFSEKYALKIYSKLAGKHTCRNVISIKLQSNFIEITLRHGCSPVNLLFSEHLVIITPLKALLLS